jgi:UDP-N-acetylglucosamine acyltransferase
MKIHPTAILEDGARLGADVEVGPFCSVGPHVELGDGVRLISHTAIMGATRIGARTVVHSGAQLGGEAQIRGNNAPAARLEIGEDCVIRETVTMNAGSARDKGVTSVGDRGYFMSYCHVGHDCHVGNDVTFANGAQLAGHCEIGDGVVMGGLSAVQQFGRIGRGAMLGGLSGANTDIIPYGIAAGPHAELANLNLIGLKRRGIPRDDINALRAAFRAIFREEEGSLPDRAKRARDRWGSVAEVNEVVDFILAPAKRPICLARRRGGVEADEP